MKKTYRIFDIIGPRMIGPSSSHTAGAARIGLIANRLVRGDIKRAQVTLYESFATTGRGHGTDLALAGGLLGFPPDDERLRDSLSYAEHAGVEISFVFSDQPAPHPNTARIVLEKRDGETLEVLGASVGGGNIEILEIDGMEVSFSCNYPTLLVFHRDVPGSIQRVSGILAESGINIAFMRVFRTARNADACMVIEMDGKPPRGLVAHILNSAPEIRRACVL